MLFGRRRWDPQPTTPAAVLLASSGAPFSRAAVRRAMELAGGGPVAVLSILKVYGSQFGLPNPGRFGRRPGVDRESAVGRRRVAAVKTRHPIVACACRTQAICTYGTPAAGGQRQRARCE